MDLVCESTIERSVALHFNPRFTDLMIVRNSMTAGQWDQEEREGAITIAPGGDFNVEFLCQDEGYKASLLSFCMKEITISWY